MQASRCYHDAGSPKVVREIAMRVVELDDCQHASVSSISPIEFVRAWYMAKRFGSESCGCICSVVKSKWLSQRGSRGRRNDVPPRSLLGFWPAAGPKSSLSQGRGLSNGTQHGSRNKVVLARTQHQLPGSPTTSSNTARIIIICLHGQFP